jgi:hypothetical protein
MEIDLVEVIGGVEAQVAGEAVDALREAGIPVDVRSAGRAFKPPFGSGNRSYGNWLPWSRMI